jgi:hypothetical protein
MAVPCLLHVYGLDVYIITPRERPSAFLLRDFAYSCLKKTKYLIEENSAPPLSLPR